MDWGNLYFSAELGVYRLSGFLLLSVIEDPAWLALIFC